MRTLTRVLVAAATRSLAAAVLVAILVGAAPIQPATALPGRPSQVPPKGVRATNPDTGTVTGLAWDTEPAQADDIQPAAAGSTGTGSGGHAARATSGPTCWYEAPRWTTQVDQRTEIRPWEQRPGRWGWRVCDNGEEDFVFFPDAPDAPGAPAAPAVDPQTLAESVTLTPQVPTVHTSPPVDALHLVNLETWFWVDRADWSPDSRPASAGSVSVTVTATPGTLVIDPGDGSPPIRCPGGGTPYDPALPADAQHSACTHTYTEPGTHTARATVVYDVAWTSNLAPGGPLGDVTPTARPFTLQVAEGQAVVVTGDRNPTDRR